MFKKSKGLFFLLPLSLSLFSLIDYFVSGADDETLDFYLVSIATVLICSFAIFSVFSNSFNGARFKFLSLSYAAITLLGILITLFHSRNWEGEFWDKFCYILGLPFSPTARYVYFETGISLTHSRFLLFLNLLNTLTIPFFISLALRTSEQVSMLKDSTSLFCMFCGESISTKAVYCPKCGKQQNQDVYKKDEPDPDKFLDQTKLNVGESDGVEVNEIPESSLDKGNGTKKVPTSVIAALLIFILFALLLIQRNNSFSDPFKPLSDLTSEATINTPDLVTATNSREITDALNLLGFGTWAESTSRTTANAKVYVSDWPCLIYMTSDLSTLNNLWDLNVVYSAYAGGWLRISSKNWLINDPSSSRACVQYFADTYGGQIVSN